ncbi:hypothetical protein [Parabacteroides sp. ZJ-118]|uniref:hypothetical protein n=1 Tax=Parabacteroides sp. ZJ-118 TaxID=2709398 RepID=UPI0013E9D72D|nr:hypothetical protein [Parabacteroides sp. ZJ-118]
MFDEEVLKDLQVSMDRITYYTCPYCGKRSLVSEATIVSQKYKTISRETKIKTGCLGKMYAETTEVYSAYNIRICKDCARKQGIRTKTIALLCWIILPSIIGFIKMSWVSFFCSIFLGLILSGIVFCIVEQKVDVEDAFEKNAIAPPTD